MQRTQQGVCARTRKNRREGISLEQLFEELFAVRDGPPARVVSHRATRRTYGRYLLARGRLAPRDTTGPRERCIEEYGGFLREVRGLAATTTATHQATASDFLAHALLPTLALDALNAAHVERYVAKKGAEVTRQTLQHTVAHLRAFLRYCFDRGLIPERLDAMDTPRTYRGEQPPRAMPWSLVLGLLRSVDRSDPVGWRDYAMLHLMAYYGLRPSEVVALEVGAVDLDVRTLRVTQRKTASELLLPLAVPTVRVLQKHLAAGAAVAPTLSGKRLHPHSLRHSTAVQLLKADVDFATISQWLGHSSVNTTMRYARVDIDLKRAALSQVFPEALEPPKGGRLAPDRTDVTAWLRRL